MIRVGILGTGAMATRMARAFSSIKGVEVVAVASRSPSRAHDFSVTNRIHKAYRSYAELIEASGIDLVYIATENSSHAQLSMLSLDQKKAVLCEKPSSTSFDEVQAVVSCARRNNCLYIEAYWHLLLPSIGELLRWAKTSAHASTFSFVSSFGYPNNPELESNLFRGDSGVVYDRLGYLVSLSLLALGEIHEWTAHGTCDVNMVPLNCFFQAQHKTGGTTQLSASLNALLPNSASLSSAAGRISLLEPFLPSEGVSKTYCSAPTSLTRQSKLGETLKRFSRLRVLGLLLKQYRFTFRSYGYDAYHPLLTHVLDCLKQGKIESPVISHKLSLETASVLDAVQIKLKRSR